MDRLSATGGDLPLAFQVADHLEGDGPPYASYGKPVYGTNLERQLESEGVGTHDVTVSGLFAMPGQGGRELYSWEKQTTLLGSLDIRTVSRAIYAMARDFIKGYAKGDTPPEIYVTGIQVGAPSQPDLFAPPSAPAKPLPPLPKRIRKGQRQYVGYVDSKTGEFISHDKYLHSRRALRAIARRKGLARPKRGRYRKTLIDLPSNAETADDSEE